MRLSLYFILFTLAFGGAASASPDTLNRAESLYEKTQYEASLRVLASDRAPGAATYSLIGRNCFMLGRYGEAGESFRKAATLDPRNAEYALWLGRTFGRKAEKSHFVTAPVFASEAREYFERAVALDPSYREALNDLFSYYLDAPGFLGGGLDKAEAIAVRTKPLSPAEYEFDEAQIALKRKNSGGAEAHLRRAFDLAPREAGRAIDVARFLARHGRVEESEKWFEQAEKIAPDRPATIFARAQTYIETGRHPDEARRLLRRYLVSPITPDDPPRETAEKLFRQTTATAG